MQTFGAYLVALLAASAELASGLPQPMDRVSPRAGQTLSVPVKRNTVYKKHPAVALAKVYAKYGKEMPTRLKTLVANHRAGVGMAPEASKRSDAQGSVVNKPTKYDAEYTAEAQIGTPPQTLALNFDTGSADLWVFSNETSTRTGEGHQIYSPDKSSTAARMDGASWEIHYGDQSFSRGNVYTDVVSIGNVSVQSQAVESAEYVSAEFTEDTAMSGIVGLAFSFINTVTPKPQTTFFENAMPQLSQPVFTADLKHDADGSYNFGYIDKAAYTGDIFYLDVVTNTKKFNGLWSFEAKGYAIGGGSGTPTSGSGSNGTGGTGTSSTGTSSTASTGSDTASSSGSGSEPSGGNPSVGGDSSSSSGLGSLGSLGDLGSLLGGLAQSQGAGSSDSSSSGDSVWAGWFNKLMRKSNNNVNNNNKAHESRSAPPTRQHAPVTAASKRAVTLTDTAMTGIADTGTSLLFLPDEVVKAYYAQVSGAQDSFQDGGYVFPCDSKTPDFTFGVGSGQITVPGSYINWAPVDSAGSSCFGGIQSDADLGLSIYGDVALKAAFVVFDGGAKRIGWAAKATS